MGGFEKTAWLREWRTRTQGVAKIGLSNQHKQQAICFLRQSAIRLLAATALIVLFVPQMPALASAMIFRLGSAGGTDGKEWIVADGEITASTPVDFLTFLTAHEIKPGTRYEVFLNSPGGSLIGGVKLGEVVRQFGLGTRVARSVALNFAGAGYQFEDEAPGECYSACALAFLGGKWRVAQGGSVGVHQHYQEAALKDPLAKNFSGIDLSVQQVVSGLLADYIVRMGVDARFLTRASTAAPSEIYYFTNEELISFGITFNDLNYSDWVLEPYKTGLIAVSRTPNLENTATLFCRKDRIPRLRINVPTRLATADPVLPGFMVNLFGTEIPATGISAKVENAHLIMEFHLPPQIDPDNAKSTNLNPGTKLKGMSALGANRFWYYHELPSRHFKEIESLVLRNCF